MKNVQQDEILSFIQNKQFATVEDISTSLFISPSTVRRNLTKLQSMGLIIRTRGGAKVNDSSNFMPSFSFRAHKNSLEKKKIALLATRLVKNGDVVFLDGSTSSFFMAEYLANFKDIKVITNGVDTLSLLAKKGVDAYSTGGYLLKDNNSVLGGEYAISMINKFHEDYNDPTLAEEFKFLCKVLLVVLIPSILTFLQPDTGVVLIYLLITMLSLYSDC